MRCVAEFRNAGRVRDQEFHIAVVDHVPNLIGTEDGMDRNKDPIGPKHSQDRNDLIEGLLHANADAVTRQHSKRSETLCRGHGLSVELAKGERLTPAENGLLVVKSRQRLLELCGYGRQLSGSSDYRCLVC